MIPSPLAPILPNACTLRRLEIELDSLHKFRRDVEDAFRFFGRAKLLRIIRNQITRVEELINAEKQS